MKLGSSVFCAVVVKDLFSALLKDNHLLVAGVFVLDRLIF